jgi:hypothetical protein
VATTAEVNRRPLLSDALFDLLKLGGVLADIPLASVSITAKDSNRANGKALLARDVLGFYVALSLYRRTSLFRLDCT